MPCAIGADHQPPPRPLLLLRISLAFSGLTRRNRSTCSAGVSCVELGLGEIGPDVDQIVLEVLAERQPTGGISSILAIAASISRPSPSPEFSSNRRSDLRSVGSEVRLQLVPVERHPQLLDVSRAGGSEDCLPHLLHRRRSGLLGGVAGRRRAAAHGESGLGPEHRAFPAQRPGRDGQWEPRQYQYAMRLEPAGGETIS